MLGKLLFPLLSVWVIIAYIHLLQLLLVFEKVVSRRLILILFVPVILFEFYVSLRFPHAMAWADVNRGWIVLFVAKTLFWFAFFLVWVFFMNFTAKKAVIIKWFITKFYLQLSLVFLAERWITLVAFGIWALLYYFITVQWGMLRIFTAMIVPMLLCSGLIFHLYHWGGVGSRRRERILKQKGIMDSIRFERIGEYKVPRHPREIYYDRKADALFCMYGATYGQQDKPYPTIIRLDMKTGRLHAFLSRNIRQVHFDESARSVFVAPWYDDRYYELSMDDLKVRKERFNQVAGILTYWEPMDIVKDASTNRVYVGNDAEQVLLAYDNESGRLESVLNLLEQGLVSLGGPLWNVLQSRKTRRLYFSAGPGRRRFYDNHLFEVDPDSLSVVKMRPFFDVCATALALDEENNLIYYQSGGFNTLHEIDLETFQTRRTFRGEGHARCMCLDRKRSYLYVLGYFSGSLFPIDLTTGKRLSRVRVGGLPHGMHVDGDTLWVTSMSGVFRLDIDQIWGHGKKAKPASVPRP